MTYQVTLEATDEQALSKEQPDATIVVNWQKDKGIEYWVLEKHSRMPSDGGSVPATSVAGSEIEFWRHLCKLLGDAVQLSGLSENELNSLWQQITDLGKYLGEKLLSAELRNFSSTWLSGSIVTIATNEQWVPWELIYDSNGFWGSRFILARNPKIPRHSSFSPSDKIVVRCPSTHLRRIVNIIGGELQPSKTVEQVKKLFTPFVSNIDYTDLVEVTLTEVMESVTDTDIIHFTCHGHITPHPYLQLAVGQSPIRCLMPTNVQSLPLSDDSVIFANACTSAVIASFLGELHNFGWEFYKKGAAVYIGTLGLVPTEYAVTFAERFYEKLLNGGTVGESLYQAKLDIQRKNPFWLFYCLYGDPFTRKVAQHPNY
jgi:hypothetical protein